VTASPRWRIALVVWVVAIVVSGLVPIASMVEVVGPPDPVTMAGHFVAYAILGYILAVTLGGRRVSLRTVAFSFGLALALGVVVELLQGPIPYRDTSLFDLAVDAAGAAVGLAVFSVVASGGRSRWRPG
jgi:VanZ family protein